MHGRVQKQVPKYVIHWFQQIFLNVLFSPYFTVQSKSVSTANRSRASPNLILCSIIVDHQMTYVYCTTTLTTYIKKTYWFCRCGICSAWSYDETEELCFMHTADGCCGQKEKQVQKSNWISGYFCVHCWSTKHQCPCSLKDRLKGQNGCKIAQNSGATKPQYNNPTVSPYQNFYISKLKKKSLNQLIDCPNIMISVPLKLLKLLLL